MTLGLKFGASVALLGGLLGIVPVSGYAQQVDGRQLAAYRGTLHSTETTALSFRLPEVSAPGSISGTVVDGNGVGIPGAKVKLISQADFDNHTTESDSTGHFSFEGVTPGMFRITIASPGMETVVTPDYVLHTDEQYVLPQITLRVHADFAVQVRASQAEVAHEQLKTLEKQRVLAIFPNFYTSYFSDPAPLTTRQKYDLAIHAVSDPGTFLSAGAVAGIEQAENIFPGYGQGAQGYLKRFGAATADSAISRMVGSAVLPSLLHQDPRYFYKGSGTARSRIIYALKMTVVCKGDEGRNQPNYSHIGGSFASGAISNLYHAREDRGIGLTMVQSLLDFTGRASNNLIQEFLLRKVTNNVPTGGGSNDTAPKPQRAR